MYSPDFLLFSSRAYLCAKCKNLYETVLLYETHLDTCDGENEDYNFELVVSDEPTNPLVAGNSNKINIMNVIKTEVMDDSDALTLMPEQLNQNHTLHDTSLNEQAQYLEEHLV